MTPRRDRAAGLTMIEIMVSVALVGIATAFVFSIQIKMTGALRDQQTVSEAQQTLRSASELILRDLRMAGYLAQQVATPGGTIYYPVTVVNGGVDGGPDELIVIYADTSAVAPINSNTASAPLVANGTDGWYTGTGTYTTMVTGFAVGNLVLLTHAGIGPAVTTVGIGCTLAVTSVTAATNLIKTDPGAGGAPWNTPNNAHCTAVNLGNFYNDGLSEFTKVVFRRYRIRPGDARGVLEMSPSGGLVAGDYQPLALGIADMQIALRLSLASNPAPCALDADATHDWVSSDNMNNLGVPLPGKVIEASLTLLAKTSKEVQGVGILQTPDLFDDALHKTCNHTGDVAGKALPIAAVTSPYHGDFVYRTYTATVDLRNANAQN